MARITVQDIQRAVGMRYKITREEMVGPRRTKRIARPRQIAMVLCREMTDISGVRIALLFGGRDHTTLNCARRVVPLRIAASEKLRFDMEFLREIIPLIAQEREEREARFRNAPLSWERGTWEAAG